MRSIFLQVIVEATQSCTKKKSGKEQVRENGIEKEKVKKVRKVCESVCSTSTID